MKTFIAGVGRALLYKGDELFADCRTLTESGITLGLTPEDVRGGEGNVTFGRYFHDASFGLKLTDAMFSLEYLAANTGATWSHKADVFNTESCTVDSNYKITLAYAPVAVQTGGTAYVMWKKSTDTTGEYTRIAYTGSDKKITFTSSQVSVGDEICVLYRYNNAWADTITIDAQFIPETLHAVLTMALYAGDSCNIGASTTKIGEVVVDVPRFQLSGSQDLSLTAGGASTVSLEGTALASSCSGCDGKPTYATISRILYDQKDANWTGVVIEDGNFTLSSGESKEMVAYCTMNGSVPHKADDSQVVWSADSTSYVTVAENVVKFKATGTAQITATVTINGTTKTATVTCTCA